MITVKLDAIELRMLQHYLAKIYDLEKASLKKMDEDSDQYMELANDLMVMDVILSKLKSERPNR